MHAEEVRHGTPGRRLAGGKWALRAALAVLLVLAVVAALIANRWLSERFVETTRNRNDVRLALYSGNLLSELQRTAVLPLLLARDPELMQALRDNDFSRTSGKLISLQSEIGVASIRFLDGEGRVVAATNRNILGTVDRGEAYFIEAQRTNETTFTATRREAGGYDFAYSRALRSDGKVRGVIVVSVDLMKYERAWAGLQDAVVVTDSEGMVLLSTVYGWRGKALSDVMAGDPPGSAVGQALRAASAWTGTRPDALLHGEPMMVTEARVPFQGWHIYSFTDYSAVRERVNGILAIGVMGFAIVMAIGFYFLSRHALLRSQRLLRESAELRRLNLRLQREIAEREKVEANLQVAEQTLEQSSKLAVLGEMSAAVSHELNQPLAAMKTYLAGARLLLQRRRPDDALSSFQRIDDLIERMGAITRQLKSYARKGGEAFEPVDMRACLSSALAMMEPQLKTRRIKITRALPRRPVMVLADRIRLEQVIINLLRNALDALRDTEEPRIELILTVADRATLLVRDNGHGLTNLEDLFEPFYTTKKPGEGVGLGLAISSGIASDLGGRLTARNAEGGGAVFELQLPLLAETAEAAQ